MNRIAVLLAAMAMVVGCKPSDTNVKTVKERIDSGEIVWFSEANTKLPTCGTAPDWLGIRGTPNEEQERVVVGQQRSIVGTRGKNFPCYRIGSTILLNEDRPQEGKIVVHSIGLARLDFLRAKDLKGRYFEAKSEFTGYTKRVASRMGGNAAGYIYILNVAYVAGSASNEKLIKENDAKDGYEETDGDGKGLDCDTWTTLDVAPTFQGAVLDGKIKSYFKLGSQNCIPQGQIIELKTAPGLNAVTFAKARVKKVKRIKIKFMKENHFDLVDYDFKTLKNFISSKNSSEKEIWITIVDFDLWQPGSVITAQNCPTINLTRPLKGEVRIDADSARCARKGDLTEVVTINGSESLSIPVRVKSRIDDPESSTVVLEFERLDENQNQGELP